MYEIGQTLLKLEDVSLSFGSNLILKDLNLEIRDINRTETTGQVCTIVGKSGVGKSQLLNIIAGILKPSSGTVKIGLDQKPVVIGEVGMVAQNYPLFEHYTLNTNLKLVCKDQSKIDELLNEFNLFDRKNLYPVQLSGGQRQRAAIVQQFLCSEHFILLDEPFSGLDPIATEKLCNVIQKVAHKDSLNTVIITSHILEPSLAVSDTVFILGHEYADLDDNTALVSPFDIAQALKKGETQVKIPGAKIRFVEDLAAKGFSWREDIRYDSAFLEFVKHIEKSFKVI